MQLPFHNTEIKHWNPGQTEPLIFPVHLLCNTSDEDIYANIRENSAVRGGWVKCEDAHDGIAVICGSGPSLMDTLPEIRAMKEAGGLVFALNGAATFLYEHGIMPDYQVLIDARIGTADLIGPAKRHLFASQVHPECFRRAPDAQLWHLQVGAIESLFPDYEEGYALIGGAASVGNTATCLAYAMGFRDVHCFGYDSSHREGMGHAFPQAMNNGDPCAIVDYDGESYVASLTMKLQAERFIDTARALEGEGCKVFVHGDGLLPHIWRNRDSIQPDSLETDERAKYEAMWSIPSYRNMAPGEHYAAEAFSALHMHPGDTVLDFGCGTGRGAAALQSMGCKVTGIDLASNSLDAGVKIPVIRSCLWDLPDVTADHGYCTDVMEHIPAEKVHAVLSGIAARVPQCFFNISTQPDAMGVLIGKTLHLTVRNADWWLAELLKHWPVVGVTVGQGEMVAVCRT